jgi:hypothetical protein
MEREEVVWSLFAQGGKSHILGLGPTILTQNGRTNPYPCSLEF